MDFQYYFFETFSTNATQLELDQWIALIADQNGGFWKSDLTA
jgi:hypothetical protein